MKIDILYSDNYTNIVDVECTRAYKVYLLSEPMFIFDAQGLGVDPRQLRNLIKRNLRDLRSVLQKSDSAFVDFFHAYSQESEGGETKLTSFIYELYNILIMHVYLMTKYSLKTKNAKLNQQLLSNNLAMSIIEGSAIGKYQGFEPYFSRNDGSRKGSVYGNQHKGFFSRRGHEENRHDDFYYAQNSFLRHQLLMLVVLYRRYEILPSISYSKVGQKNIVTTHIEVISKNNSIPTNFFDDDKWSSSLRNVITNFEEIMNILKSATKRPSVIKLANIYFNREFIKNFEFTELLHSYVFQEDLLVNKIPSETQITETIGRILDSKLQAYSHEDKVWSYVVNFMKLFPYQVTQRKNNHINFSDGGLINIFNNNKKFGIDVDGSEVRTKQSYTELQERYKNISKKTRGYQGLRAEDYFFNTYIF